MANKSNKALLNTNKQFLDLHMRILMGVWAFYLLLRVIFFKNSMDMWQWIYFLLSVGVEGAIMYQFYSASRPSYSATGELLDGGHDLNQPGGLNDYMRDALYISMACQLLCVLTDAAWYLFLLIPAIGGYKLWTGILQPMLAMRQ